MTASAHPQGVALDFEGTSELDLGNGKRPINLRVRNYGNIDANVVLGGTGTVTVKALA